MPLTRHTPRERIDYMLKDSGAGLILTTGNIASVMNRTHLSDMSPLSYTPGKANEIEKYRQPLGIRYLYLRDTGKPKE